MQRHLKCPSVQGGVLRVQAAQYSRCNSTLISCAFRCLPYREERQQASRTSFPFTSASQSEGKQPSSSHPIDRRDPTLSNIKTLANPKICTAKWFTASSENRVFGTEEPTTGFTETRPGNRDALSGSGAFR
ncbi:hypothetical protein ZHAS_00010115 [Anopheles sinensis]|uniref:Uncharacterized protein n=1 Tax=Anopheles sinensis TaxID=74873 RepID=A0A084VWS4_ANOSI|nr:hypothetical protein ZHAS_00010115 [Anopheles sinensis]